MYLFLKKDKNERRQVNEKSCEFLESGHIGIARRQDRDGIGSR